MSKANKILWRCATTQHNWSNFDYANFLAKYWLEHGIIGFPESLILDEKIIKLPKLSPDHLLSDVNNCVKDLESKEFGFSIAGTAPYEWELRGIISEFNSELGKNEGYSTLSLILPKEFFSTVEASTKLLDLFQEIHRPENCEFAGIHPYEEYTQFLNELSLKRLPVLTIQPMFAFPFWATFLGPGHFESFDWIKLESREFYRQVNYDSSGISFALSPEISDFVSNKSFPQLLELHNKFRLAEIKGTPTS